MLSEDDQKLLNEVKYLREKYGVGMIDALWCRRAHRDIDIDSKEMKAYLAYRIWCHGWYGNKSVERFIASNPQYEDVYLQVGDERW